MEAMSEEAFVEAGTTKDIFDEWQNTSEALVKDKLISLGELKAAWGINKKSVKLPDEPAETTPRVSQVSQPPAAPQQPLAMGVAMGAPPQMQMQSMQMQQPGIYNQQRTMLRQGTAGNLMANFGMAGHMGAVNGAMQTVTTTVQRTIVQQPQHLGVQKMAATVPWGMYGGMMMTVNTPHGQMRVTIPPGYGPGSSFTFNVPRKF